MTNRFINPDTDRMGIVLKKAIARFKSTASQSKDAGKNAGTAQATAKVNPLKLNSVERRLDAADKAILPAADRPTRVSNPDNRAPKLSEIQQNEDYYRQEQQRIQSLEKAKAREAFERILRHELYGEPLAAKPIPLKGGASALESTGGASLSAGGPLAKNGARTRGYTDTASDSGAPIRFTAGTMEDKRRKYDEAMVRQAVTLNDFHDYLDWGDIDRSNLSAEQKDILQLVEQELTKKSVLGTLTEQERNTVFKNTLNYLYSHTKSANGDPYPIFIDIAKTGVVAPYDAIIDVAHEYDYLNSTFPEQIAMNTDILSDKELKSIFEYGRQKSAKSEETEKYRQQFAYKNNVYLKEMNNFYDDLRRGKATSKDRKKYLDQALLRIYEDCFKPVPVKDKRGKDAGTVPIGELIPPYDDSFGAQVAREAMRLLGLEYLKPAGQGKYDKMEIDCSRLVNWAVAEVNEDLGINGISKSAGYQMAAIDELVWPKPQNLILKNAGMRPGDTLYWRGNETGEIKHTAIYIGQGLMIEAGETVQIVPVRTNTTNNNGEDSTLVCVKRMSERKLQDNADENKR